MSFIQTQGPSRLAMSLDRTDDLRNRLAQAVIKRAPRIEQVEILQRLLINTKLCPRTHPLGMVYQDLGSTPYGDLRLNVWPRKCHLVGDVHNHPWDLVSRVLVGKLRNNLYRIDTGCSSAPMTIWLAPHRGAAGEGLLKSTKRSVKIRLAKTSLHEADETYTIRRGDFHTSQSLGFSPSITLLIKVQPSDEHPLVLKKEGEGAVLNKRPAASIHAFWSALQILWGGDVDKFTTYTQLRGSSL